MMIVVTMMLFVEHVDYCLSHLLALYGWVAADDAEIHAA